MVKKVIFLICSILILGLTGCDSKGDSEALNKYFDNLKNCNSDTTYEYLSSSSKDTWTSEDFKEFLNLAQETNPTKDINIEKTNEYKNKELDGITYKNVVEYNITETYHDNFEDKDVQTNYVRNAVNENGQWKVYRGKEDAKEKIAQLELCLANMYYLGKGKSKDLNQAATILNESIEKNSSYSGSYYLLGNIYNELKRYDEAIDAEQQFLNKEKDDKAKSDGYNILGLAYENKKDYSKAKECYTKAIELNANNQYAKTNIEKYANVQSNNNSNVQSNNDIADRTKVNGKSIKEAFNNYFTGCEWTGEGNNKISFTGYHSASGTAFRAEYTIEDGVLAYGNWTISGVNATQQQLITLANYLYGSPVTAEGYASLVGYKAITQNTVKFIDSYNKNNGN